ncbi:DUF4871 domain-containing protein [Mechercharimyces sp. CAU 1602]|uniref:DUF4871 domain-containing protein n=1 Tax=Mechercharimyces sp. CAU 1602 TaxID=2973933 RepID=UPI00216249EE|nr:DUF4871 domain-containing protein [Mechercharimyces sp. CAU 1602]MCS1352081.1 DUF4871 domain-containing protein [Mechercharimyces sp. CAU 1602]
MKKISISILILSAILFGCQSQEETDSKREPQVTVAPAPSEKADWTLSSTFNTSGLAMVGIPNKLGFPDNDVFVAGQPRKVMWHIWGDEVKTEDRPTMEVRGVRKDSDREERLLFEKLEPAVPNNGADTSVVSSITLPEAGMWRLDVYLDGVYFESIVVDVKERTES